MARHWGHPDHDAPEFHLAAAPYGPAPRRLDGEQLRQLEAALFSIDSTGWTGHPAVSLAGRAALPAATDPDESRHHNGAAGGGLSAPSHLREVGIKSLHDKGWASRP
jgi:hypothetical protein